MSAHENEPLWEMFVALAPILLGLAALLITVISVWQFHEVRLRRRRASGSAGAEPKFMEGIAWFGWPVLALYLPFRGLGSRSDVIGRIPGWTFVGIMVGSILLYPVAIFAYVMSSRVSGLPVDGKALKIIPAGMLAASLLVSLVAARVFGWH
jgi:hypothetical protein